MSQSCISLIPSSCWIWWQSWRSRTCPWFRTLRGWRRLWSSSNSPWKQPRRISKHVTWLCYITQWLNLFLLAASELLSHSGFYCFLVIPAPLFSHCCFLSVKWKGWKTNYNADKWNEGENREGEGERRQAWAEGPSPRVPEYTGPGNTEYTAAPSCTWWLLQGLVITSLTHRMCYWMLWARRWQRCTAAAWMTGWPN